jgi:hypothetical protein
MRDEIIDRVRATREAYAAKFNFDVMAMVRDLRERELASGRVLLPIPHGLNEPKAAESETPMLPRNVAA